MMSHRPSRVAVLLALALLSVAANCEQCQPVPNPRRGNVDRVTDAVLVTGADQHTYLVSANPELQHLRVLDLTAEVFVDGPNRYFPLSIPVGDQTARLAVSDLNATRLFALDSASDSVVMIGTAAATAAERWQVIGEPIACETGAIDIAVTARDGLFSLWLTLSDRGALQHLVVDAAGAVSTDALVALAPDARPFNVEADVDGITLLVSDAQGSAVHVVDVASASYLRGLDVGGPTGAISIGAVQLADGMAPVALVARRDATEVWALRLLRPGFREDAYAVLGGVETGTLPLVTYVPNQTDSTTVCCRGLSSDSVARGEATRAWGAVGLANGTVIYLALSAATDDPLRRVVRVIDDDPATVAFDDVLIDPISGTDNLFVPGPGVDGALRRPVPQVRAREPQGDPPFAAIASPDEIILLVYEGVAPNLARMRVAYAAGSATAATNFVARDVRVGDRATFVAQDVPAQCADRKLTATVLAVSDGVFTVERGAGTDALDAADEACLIGNGEVRASVAVARAFVATDRDGAYLGRLVLLPADFDAAVDALPPDGEVLVSGGALSVLQSPVGEPYRDSRLAVPLDPHVVTLGLNLAASVNAGGVGQAGYVATSMVGGIMRFPKPTDATKIISARRMIVTTGSADGAGTNVVLSCDDAETVTILCDQYR